MVVGSSPTLGANTSIRISGFLCGRRERENCYNTPIAMTKKQNYLMQDLGIIVISVILAIMLAKTKILAGILTTSQTLEWLGSLVAGVFFTSIFTAAPSVVTLGAIAQDNSILATAFFGGIGAMLGDLIIFRFVRDRLSEHLTELVRQKGGSRRLRALIRLRLFRYLTILFGGLIIASPLPDEIGISLLGISKIKTPAFLLLSFCLNFLGILLIGVMAKSL